MSYSLNCQGKLLSLDNPIVMGVINVNGDSFYSASRANTIDQVLEKAKQMVDEGASIIDVGAMSSRPGAHIIDEQIESQRIVPMIRQLHIAMPHVIISADTMRGRVAETCVEVGASIINDISSGDYDPDMMRIVASLKVPYVMMHMQGLPLTMQVAPVYNDVILDIMKYFVSKIYQAKQTGIRDLVLDPGFGFGKTIDHNYKIMNELDVFNIFEIPILIGVSRKSMINSLLNIKAKDALTGTIALHMAALFNGAKILRVHDVKQAMECIAIYNKLVETQLK